MHPYRTHNCGELRTDQVGETVRLSGWVHRKRDHGQLLFIDLRDHYGITQVVFQPEHPFFADAENVRLESVLTVTGRVVARSPETVNPQPADRRGRGGRRRPGRRGARRSSCRSRSTPSATIRRTPACAFASSTCGARRCSRTSCCARA